MNKFTIGLIVTVGILITGIAYMASTDLSLGQSTSDIVIINALNNIEYDQFRDNDIHYERADREKKYYGSMTDIELLENNSIEITFGEDYFDLRRDNTDVKSNLQSPPSTLENSRFVATIQEGQTFVAGCNHFGDMPNRPNEAENTPAKQIHVLKYNGITEKNGTSYYGFAHEAGYIPGDFECIFPEMVQHSLDIDFDISDTNFYGDVWDFDWK
ncbi:MAG: hypothetical protein ACR2LL_11140 [Nitrosopumilus sp.]